jgi:hypothetical protein
MFLINRKLYFVVKFLQGMKAPFFTILFLKEMGSYHQECCTWDAEVTRHFLIILFLLLTYNRMISSFLKKLLKRKGKGESSLFIHWRNLNFFL